MNNETKQLLTRWQSLQNESALKRAGSVVRTLWFVGFALCIFVVFGIVYRLHPALVAVAAAAMGWVTAERNALRTRISQWPIVRNYIDWPRVENDLTNDTVAYPCAAANTLSLGALGDSARTLENNSAP